MNVLTHAAVGIALSRFFAPELMPIAVGFSLLPDVDHLLNISKWEFRVNGFETSQTAMHGILGLTVYGMTGLVMFTVNQQLGSLFLIAVAFHLLLDFMGGVSIPFRYIEKNPVRKNFGNPPENPLGARFWLRVLQEASVIVVSLLIFIG